MNVSITYQAQSVEDLCASIQAVRALGLPAPTVAIARPAASTARRADSEPNVEAYLSARGETIFRLCKAEKEAGMTRDQAAASRMQCEGWQGVALPQDATSFPDPEPFEGGALF